MKNNTIVELTYEEVMSNPAYEHLREAATLLQTATFADLFPRKHFVAHRDLTLRRLRTLHHETPDLPLNEALAKLLTQLPADSSPAFLLEMTQVVVAEWERLTAAVHA